MPWSLTERRRRRRAARRGRRNLLLRGQQSSRHPGWAGQQPVAAAAADLNGDGNPDVAVLNAASTTIGILLGDGTGALLPTSTLGSGGAPTWLVAADLDGDQRPDLALSSGTAGAVTRLNTTPFPLSRPLPPAPAPPGIPPLRCGSVLLTGRLAATAYPTRWYFEYRVHRGPWKRTRPHTVEPDDDPIPVSARIAVSRSEGPVRFRLVVRSAGHRVRGEVSVARRPCGCRPER